MAWKKTSEVFHTAGVLPQQGQHELGHHRLHPEDQARADHERGGEEREHAGSLGVPGRGVPAGAASRRGGSALMRASSRIASEREAAARDQASSTGRRERV